MMDSSAEEPGAYPGLGQAILLILALVTSQFILAIATIIIIGEDTFHWFTQFVISVISFGLAISIGLQAGRLSLKEVMALRPVHNGVWIPLIILLAGLTIVLSEIDNALRSVWPMPESLVEAFLQLRANWIAFILLGVLLAPITEELLFRGLILRGLLQHYSVNRAVVLSALLFAMVHLSPWQFTGAFVFGLLSRLSLLPDRFAHTLPRCPRPSQRVRNCGWRPFATHLRFQYRPVRGGRVSSVVVRYVRSGPDGRRNHPTPRAFSTQSGAKPQCQRGTRSRTALAHRKID